MKLNKTETVLLERMQNSRYGTTTHVSRAYGQTRHGGKVNEGNREYNAALSLIKKGLVKEINRHKSTQADRGYTVWVSDIVIGLPEKE